MHLVVVKVHGLLSGGEKLQADVQMQKRIIGVNIGALRQSISTFSTNTVKISLMFDPHKFLVHVEKMRND